MLRSLAVVLLLVPGCAYGSITRAYAPSSVMREEMLSSYGASGGGDSGADGGELGRFVGDDVEPEAVTTESTGTMAGLAVGTRGPDLMEDRAQPALYAQAQTSVAPPDATATDAIDTSGELMIYTALFYVGVYDVATGQAAIAESARAVGGLVFSQSDDTIVIRVPAARFTSFVAGIDADYDVLHRQIDAQDVGEEFRDTEIRIRNLEVMRDRVAALLESAHDVEQALAVERQLERITAELESLRGRQRFLADRISFSTITVMFRPQPRDAIDQPEVFQLPFAWLESLGLPNLLELR